MDLCEDHSLYDHDRLCVAVEWSDGGNEQSSDTTEWCALAWGCDYTEPWDQTTVYGMHLHVQCFVSEIVLAQLAAQKNCQHLSL